MAPRRVRQRADHADEAVELTRTGDLWLFRGDSVADHAIRTLTNAPVNHVGMAVVLDDLPPLMWHAELGKGLQDVWTGKHQRGVQLHDLREAVVQWMDRYEQRGWLRQLVRRRHPGDGGRAAQDDRADGRAAVPLDRRPGSAGWPAAGCAAGRPPSSPTAPRWSPRPTSRWGCSTARGRRTTTTPASSGPATTSSSSSARRWARRSRSIGPSVPALVSRGSVRRPRGPPR